MAGGVQGVRAAREREGGPSQPRCRGELGARRGRSRRLRPLRPPGSAARDGLRERAQLVDVVPEQGPAGVDDDHVDAVEADRDVASGV